MQPICLYVNGEPRDVNVDPTSSLLSVLRDDLKLRGTKEGCGTGYCGACTVLVDGKAVNSCLYFAVDADRRALTTVEGLASRDGALHPVQSSFVEHSALQCGFCTPGMIVSAAAFLSENPDPTQEQTRAALAGNLCRCTGYQSIVAAVMAAARRLRDEGRAGEIPGRRAHIASRA
ncbi:MAG: (2Fe-2S)-binding protein [Candidatus Eremiobacteraeota bacterium]|nr:(2Fe-2S)-binding protein [Candidatus Eremiobacteraeota bacterium]MBC5827667.1 (2Fe-2S)-binding protein [Candidatus Eremiobacteraeota bacterium]